MTSNQPTNHPPHRSCGDFQPPQGLGCSIWTESDVSLPLRDQVSLNPGSTSRWAEVPPPPKSLSHDEQAGNIQDFELSRCISYSSIEHGWGFSSNPHVCEFRGVIFFGLYKLYRSWKFLFEDWKFPPMVNWCPFIFMESKPPGPKTKAPKLKLLKLLETWRLGERCFCLTSFYCFSKLSCGRNWRGVGT